MTNSLRHHGGETGAQGQNPKTASGPHHDCITGSSQTLHDLNHSLGEYVMRAMRDKGSHSPTLGEHDLLPRRTPLLGKDH
jgi:hypothetical protein